MANLNKVMLIGNITRNLELKYTPRGTAVLDVGLAVNRKWRDDAGSDHEETTFVDITFFGKQAETIQKHVGKGSPIYIEGRLTIDTWQDKQTGQNRTKLKVTGDTFQFLPDGKQRQDDRRDDRRQDGYRDDGYRSQRN